jgi:type VI secretion system secreted protein Hcp
MPFSAYLKLAGIEGESTDVDHRREIELLSFTFGARHLDFQSVGRTEISELQVSKPVDCASPKLLVACFKGEPLASGVLSVRSGSGRDFFSVRLSNILVTSWQVNGDASSDPWYPAEAVTFSYQKLELDYILPGPSGDPETLLSGMVDAVSLRAEATQRALPQPEEPGTTSGGY